ncbi:hypothetical protein ABZY09_11700 [Streptomyces sp. NPDC002928]|uniref:hypothetical protein n=1 Tax=Streptomyces sp. NPDC002928 TaxID=3154440 RepID=UPI0033A24DC3
MGLDITVLAVDWEELARTPVGDRQEALWEAAAPDTDWDAQPEVGWVFPASPEVPWCGRYEFHSTTGSYKPHFWAAQAWDDVRAFAGPALRAALDGFLRDLVWEGEGVDDLPLCPEEGFFPGDAEPWRLLVACPPPTVSALAAHWARAEPLLEGLREAYGAHAASPGRWIADFDEFAVLLREWAVVVGEAEERGWGLLGLPG